MSSQTENVQINLKLNGIDEFKSFQDLTRQLAAERTRLLKMDRTDPGYEAAAARVNDLITLQREWRTEIYRTSNAATQQAKDLNKSLDEQTDHLKKSFDSIKETFSGVTAANLVSDGIESGIDFLKSFVSESQAAYAEAEQGQAQLMSVIKSTGGIANMTADELNDLSGSIMKMTGVDDDVITKGEELLLTFGNVRDEVFERAMPAIVDMTAALNQGSVSMEGISGTSMMVGKALNDPIRGMTALRKIGVSFSDDQIRTVKKMMETNQVAEAQGVILKELSKEFGEVGKNLASTETGGLQKFNTRLGNIQENVGGLITGLKSGFTTAFDPFLSWIEKITTTTMAETLEKERIELNKVGFQITSVNTKQSDRIKLIKDLQEKYPTLLGNLNAEKVSNYEISRAIKLVNDQLINKIVLAKEDDKINEQNEKTAKTKMALLEAEDRLREKLVKLHEKFPEFKIPENGFTDAEKMESLLGQIYEKREKLKQVSGGVFDPTSGADQSLAAYKKLLELSSHAEQQGSAMLTKRNELMKRLGIVDEPEKPKSTAPYTISGVKTPKDNTAKEEAAKALAEDKKLNEEYKKLGLERIAEAMNTNQKEVELIRQKYQKLIEEEEKFLTMKGATDAQKKAHEDQIKALGTERDQAMATKRLDIEREMDKSIAEMRTSLADKTEAELQKEKDQINKFYDDQVKKNEGNADVILKINKDRTKDLTDAELREKNRLKDEKNKMEVVVDTTAANTHAGRLAAIKKQYDDEVLALKDKYTKEGIISEEGQALLKKINGNRDQANKNENKNHAKENRDMAIQGAETIANTLATIGNNNRKRETDMRMKSLEDQRNKELSNKNLTEDQKKAINDKFDAKVKQEKLRAWKADQNAAAKQALIGGLLGAAKALPNFVAAGIALGAGIASAIAIKAEKPPVYRKGAMVPTGPSHEQGGIDLINNATGERIGEMEGGEPLLVLSKDTYSNNRQLINDLLYNSQYRNGAPVSVNTELASKAMRYASGGMIEQANQVPSGAAPVVHINDTGGVEGKLDDLLNKWDEGIPFNYLNLVEHGNKVDKIRNRVNAK